MGVLAFIAALVQALAWPIAIVTLAVVFRRQLRTLITQFAGRMKDLKSLRAPGTEIKFADTLLAAQAEIAQLPEAKEIVPILVENESSIRQHGHWFRSTKIVPKEPGRADEEDQPIRPPEDKPSAGPPRKPSSDAQSRQWQDRGLLAFEDRLPDVIRDFVHDSPEEIVLGAWHYVEDSIGSVARSMQIWINEDRSESSLAWTVLDMLEQNGALSDAKDVFSIILKLRSLKDRVRHGATVSPFEAYDYGRSALQVVQVVKNAYYKMQAAQAGTKSEKPKPSGS